MGGPRLDTRPLLTDSERQSKLDSLMSHRLLERGQMQLPSTQHYDLLQTDKGLQIVGLEICRWIGLKPNGLRISYSDTKDIVNYKVSVSDKTIQINRQFANHPYTAGGLLAYAVLDYYIERYDRSRPDQALIEYATVETGLGLWILNALRPRISLRQRLYHLLDSAWFHADGLQLQQFHAKQYTEHLVAYAHTSRIAEETYVPHIAKRCRYLLPAIITQRVAHYLPEASAVIKARKAANLLWVKIVLLSLIIASGIAFGVYSANVRPVTNESAQQTALDDIASHKRAYDACVDDVAQRQSTYDPNDLFMTRQIDATKATCESLRNEYNYAVEQYDGVR